MLDFDLAELYEVETRVLKQAVKRNLDSFPDDFMFVLTRKELKNLTSQFVTSNAGWGGLRHLPFAFTEHGVTMLATVLKSKKARQRTIAIVKAFIAMKQFVLAYKDLAEKIAGLEKKYNSQFSDVYEALDLLLKEKQKHGDWETRKRIGFKAPVKEKTAIVYTTQKSGGIVNGSFMVMKKGVAK